MLSIIVETMGEKIKRHRGKIGTIGGASLGVLGGQYMRDKGVYEKIGKAFKKAKETVTGKD